MTCPERLTWDGVTSATSGSTMPEYSAMLELALSAARPLIMPTAVPEVWNKE